MSVLDTFREQLNAPEVNPQNLIVIPAQPGNFTGAASACGITDVEGNIAYFNCLHVKNLLAENTGTPSGAPNINPKYIQGKFGQANVNAQSIPNNALTAGNFATGNYPNSDFFVAQGTTGIKVMTAGLMLAIATYNWVAAAGGVQRIAQLMGNGAPLVVTNGSPLNASFPATGQVSYLINASVNDVISVSFIQDSGSPLSLNVCSLVVAYIGNLL